MKKRLSLLLALLLTVSLFGCVGQQQTPDTQPTTTQPTEPEISETTQETTLPPVDEESLAALLPEGAGVFGLDFSGKTLEQATEALRELISAYRLNLTVNSRSLLFSAEDLSLEISGEQFSRWFADTVEGKESGSSGLLSFRTAPILSKVKGMFGQTAKDAAVTYSKNLSKFVITPHTDGKVVDTTNAEYAAIAAIRTLSPTAYASAEVSETGTPVTAEDPRVIAALEEANSYLAISLSFAFAPEGQTPAREDLDIATLASMVKILEDYSVTVDEAVVKSYVKKMAGRYGGSRTAPFVTTYGTTLSYNVEYYLAYLDQTSLFQDLMYCLQNKISGTRATAFFPASHSDLPYGGDYVEINLSDQRLWVYIDGEMVITTPVVSGNVSTRRWTDPGIFSLQEKDRSCYLVGADYVSYVEYWMAFNGPIGLHDASWRDQFGGEIYKYNGSHGCVNLPVAAAAQIFDLVYLGMKVIVYGGAKAVSSNPQEITGTPAYHVSPNTEPFRLDVTFKYTDKTITYISSDLNVVRVNDQGVVTVVGEGTAEITVKSETYGVSFTATVTVAAEPETTEPDPTEPPETTEPESSEPEFSEPESSEPEFSEPESSEPEFSEPESSEPESSEPEAPEPSEPDPSETSV